MGGDHSFVARTAVFADKPHYVNLNVPGHDRVSTVQNPSLAALSPPVPESRPSQIEHNAQRLIDGLYPFWADKPLAR
jgi:hypothetical protein